MEKKQELAREVGESVSLAVRVALGLLVGVIIVASLARGVLMGDSDKGQKT